MDAGFLGMGSVCGWDRWCTWTSSRPTSCCKTARAEWPRSRTWASAATWRRAACPPSPLEARPGCCNRARQPLLHGCRHMMCAGQQACSGRSEQGALLCGLQGRSTTWRPSCWSTRLAGWHTPTRSTYTGTGLIISTRHSDLSSAELRAALPACSFGVVLHEIVSGKAPELRTVQPLRCGSWHVIYVFFEASLTVQA